MGEIKGRYGGDIALLERVRHGGPRLALEGRVRARAWLGLGLVS